MTVEGQRPEVATSLLVAEDDDSIRDLLCGALRFAGFEVHAATTGFEALRAVADHAPDLVVLDVNLPEIDGFEVCRRLRSAGDPVPVIFLTARRELEDLRDGLTGGGDDYLTKPFSLEELTFRIDAVLRRTRAQAAPAEEQRLRCEGLVLDPTGHRVWRDDEEVALTPTEFSLLHYLLVNQGQVLTRGQILDHVWKYDFDGNHRVVETFMSALRKKVDRYRRVVMTCRRPYGPADPARWAWLLDLADHAEVVEAGGEVVAFLVGFAEGSAYDSPNYGWFATRHERFVYVDRVAVAEAQRGTGLAHDLYGSFEEW